MIILFHRPPFQNRVLDPINSTGEEDTRKYFDTFSVQSIQFSEQETETETKNLLITISAVYKRKTALNISFTIPQIKGNVCELYYDTSRKEAIIRDYLIINPYISSARNKDDQIIYVGRVHFETENTLVYIRSHYDNVQGVTNVSMEEDKSSVDAMSTYSEEASKIFVKVMAKKDFLNEVDTLNSVSYMEAQLDIVTKIILNSGLADSDDLKEILVKADEYGIYRNNDKEKLLSKMNDKKLFREKQLAYYEKVH